MIKNKNKYYKKNEINVDKETRYEIEFGYLNEKMSNEDCNKVIFVLYREDEHPKMKYKFQAKKDKNVDIIDDNIKLYGYWKEIMDFIIKSVETKKLQEINEENICKLITKYLIKNNFYEYTENMRLHWSMLI